MANIKLLKRLKTRMARMRHPKHFDMKVLGCETECGTAMCLAGQTLALSGYKFKKVGVGQDLQWRTPDGEQISIIEGIGIAANLLELPAAARRATNSWSGPDVKNNGLFYRYDLTTPKQAAAAIQAIIDKETAA